MIGPDARVATLGWLDADSNTYLRLHVGAPCSERDRAESERILRSQPFLASAIVQYLLAFVMVYVVALIIDALAPTFDGQKDQPSALKLAARMVKREVLTWAR